jgi:hypothetical protein
MTNLNNLSVNSQANVENLKVYGNTILDGPVDINNTATINSLEVFNNTTLGGTLLEVNTTDIELNGDILVPTGHSFIVEGNLNVGTLTYKGLINDATNAQLFVEGQSITQLEVADFVDPSEIVSNNIKGYATFKTDVNFYNSPTYQSELQFGTNGSPVKITTYSSNDSLNFMNGYLNLNASSYSGGGLDYTGPTVFRGPSHNTYSTLTNISSGTITLKGKVNIMDELRIKAGASIVIESEGVSIVDLQKEVQISRQLNVSNNGTGPALRASQASPQFAEIMLLEADGLDVYTVGDNGNTQIKGKIRLGYNVVSSSNTNVNNNMLDIKLLPGENPFTAYQLDVNGNGYFATDLSVVRDVSVGRDLNVTKDLTVTGITNMTGLLTLQNDLTSYSDKRIKKNIKQLDNCLDKITNLHGYTYQRRDLDNDKYFIGLIAQEIEEPFPELVSEFEENGSTIKTVNYPAFTSVLLECIHELKEKVTQLENKILR